MKYISQIKTSTTTTNITVCCNGLLELKDDDSIKFEYILKGEDGTEQKYILRGIVIDAYNEFVHTARDRYIQYREIEVCLDNFYLKEIDDFMNKHKIKKED